MKSKHPTPYPADPSLKRGTIAIVSAIQDEWGGSEELWSKSVPLFQRKNYRVFVYKERVNFDHPRIREHLRQGAQVFETGRRRSFLGRLFDKLVKEWHVLRKTHVGLPEFAQRATTRTFRRMLRRHRPAIVVISQGINFDGMGYAYACKVTCTPYIIVSHKAVDFYWPWPDDRTHIADLYNQAKACYFVSNHNWRLTEEQLGCRFTHAKVIFNPVKIVRPIPFPAVNEIYRLCCIGRLIIIDKGQDMLLRILSNTKWKERPIHVTFIGGGWDELALKDLATLFQLRNVSFAGQVDDVDSIWQEHHALIVPSRSEGLPLTIVEAMKVGRPVICTNAGGNAELLEEGATGFIAHCSMESLEESLERAWQHRNRWEEMGASARAVIDRRIPSSPESDFVNLVIANI